MRVSGPIQCMVSLSANSEEVWHVVATHAYFCGGGFLGQVPFPADPPLWSLNAPYAKCGMRAISCKVISCSTHKATALPPLVVVHHLGHSEAQPLNDIWFGCLRVGWFRIGWEKFLLCRCCN